MSSSQIERTDFQEKLDLIRERIGGKWKLHSSENLEEALREMGKRDCS